MQCGEGQSGSQWSEQDELPVLKGRGLVTPSDQPDELELEHLYDSAQRSLHWQRLDEAKETVQKILELTPDSTSAHELWGDILLASGDKEAAAEQFERALELEPANADAERKYGLVVLQLQEAIQQREALESGDLSRFRGAANKDPGLAASRSMFFPGLGQLYNGEYQKGVILAVVGLILLVPAVDKIFGWLLASQPASVGATILGWVGLISYLLVWAYGIYDAYRSGQRIAAQQAQIGTHMPSEEGGN